MFVGKSRNQKNSGWGGREFQKFFRLESLIANNVIKNWKPFFAQVIVLSLYIIL